MNRFSLELKVILLTLFVLAIIFGTGLIAYRSLSYIVSSIDEEARPEVKLELLKEINSNLTEVESSIKYFMLTKDRKYLNPYYEIIASIDNQIEELAKLSGNKVEDNLQIDKVSQLIGEKFWVWDQMLSLQDDSRVDETLDELSARFQQKTDSLAQIYAKSDSIVIDTIKAEVKKSKILQRFFSRKKKEETIVKIDTIRIEAEHEDFEKEIIESEIVRLKEVDEQFVKRLTQQELRIIKKNEIIGREIHKMISQMEQEELKAINSKIEEANAFTLIIKKWLGAFCIVATLLLIGLLFVIFRSAARSKAYQKALIRAKTKAEDLSTAKERFLANMSHEIRTPMNAIIGFTEQILQHDLSQQQREHLGIVKKSADHLLQLINDILDFSKLESGKINLERIAFTAEEIIDDAHKLYLPLAQKKNLELSYKLSNKTNIVLLGDPFRLKQIILNLLSNAIKFTSSGKILVSASILKERTQTANLVIEVEDTGIGIPKEKLDDIFEEFTQADYGTSRQYGGSGLGLTIVRKLINLQKGQIKVSSTHGKGTKFSLSIPYLIGDKNELVKTDSTPNVNLQAFRNLNILVADDEEFNRHLLQHILKKWGAQYTIVNNGKELIEKHKKGAYDLILMDVRMPVLDGIRATEKIRILANKKKSKVPIIALTATTAREDLDKCLAVGMNQVLLKPFTESELQNALLKELSLKSDPIDKKLIQNKKEIVENRSNKPISFSLEKLYHLASNDEAFVKEMLEMFVSSTREGLADLNDGYLEKDWEKVSMIAHKICSPCRHLNADHLVGKLKSLESNATKESNKEKIKAQIDEIERDSFLLITQAEQVLKTQFKLKV